MLLLATAFLAHGMSESCPVVPNGSRRLSLHPEEGCYGICYTFHLNFWEPSLATWDAIAKEQLMKSNHPSMRGRCALSNVKLHAIPHRLIYGACVATGMISIATGSMVYADAPQLAFTGSQNGPGGVWDVTSTGQIVSIVGDSIYIETSSGSGIYDTIGLLPSGTIAPWGASFIELSPDGSQIAFGDNYFGTGHIYTVGLSDLNGGIISPTGYLHENYDAAWMNNGQIALSYGNPDTFLGEIAILDLTSGISTSVVTIGGASSGVALSSDGSLLIGNGFDMLPGGSETGEIRSFDNRTLDLVLNGDRGILDFETEGTLIADLLSAANFRFDTEGNFFVGGGDFFGGSGDFEYFALLDNDAVADAILGNGPVLTSDMFTDDPNSELSSLYSARYSEATDEWLISSFPFGGTQTIYRYAIPSPGGLIVLMVAFCGISCNRQRNQK